MIVYQVIPVENPGTWPGRCFLDIQEVEIRVVALLTEGKLIHRNANANESSRQPEGGYRGARENGPSVGRALIIGLDYHESRDWRSGGSGLRTFNVLV